MSAETINPKSEQCSLSYRVLNTRVWDLARGEITGPYRRLSWRTAYVRLIAASDLPDEPQELIRVVVKRTRLWPNERTEVAKELVAHFREGTETGASAQTLAQDFGDVRIAAKLIRRAKKRARTTAWQAWNRSRQAAMALSVVVAIVYGVLAARYFSGSPVITRNFIAELNAGVADVSEDERAWPTYVAALEILRERPKELKNTPWPAIVPGDELWEAALAFNAQIQPGIVLAIEAAQRPHLGLIVTDRIDPLLADSYYRQRGLEVEVAPAEPNPPLISVHLGYLGELRSVVPHLAFDARRAANDGDAARTVTDIEALFGVARHTRQYPFFICRMVSDAIHAEAAQTTQSVLENHAAVFTDNQLVALAHVLAAASIDPLSHAEIDAERMWFDDFMQRAYTDNGQGGGRLTPQGVSAMSLSEPPPANTTAKIGGPTVLAPLRAWGAPSRAEAIREFDRLMRESLAEMAAPIWDRGRSAVQAELFTTSERDRSVFSPRPGRMYFPNIQSSSIMIERTAQRIEVTTLAIALELFRRQHDRYPASLDELVPAFLPRVPVDRFDGRPMRYVVADGVPIVYSVGSDLDDDGGREPKDGEGNVSLWPSAITSWFPPDYAQRPIPDGDWILYTPGGN